MTMFDVPGINRIIHAGKMFSLAFLKRIILFSRYLGLFVNTFRVYCLLQPLNCQKKYVYSVGQ